ncbi:MAG: exodeoxyribonuclease VII small subunit [Proteobacteria bacterium]|nr:MAG: exodeoxyribonuclease VII small subunit [Pseudomonadota bacterium]
MKEQDFEQKLKSAKEILEKLNNPEITLNESMKLYKAGVKTLQEASSMLEKAKLVFEEVDSDG